MIIIHAIIEHLLQVRQCVNKHLNYLISFNNNNLKREALLLHLICS